MPPSARLAVVAVVPAPLDAEPEPTDSATSALYQRLRQDPLDERGRPSDLRLCGAPGRIRTCDTRFRKPLLYPLSYEGATI
jgi:hypothetical protein